MDWDSFWINIYAGSIYFVLGILVSIWLIPIFTLRLIKRKNKRFLRTKISYAISTICAFFNHMAPEYRVNDEICFIKCKNLKYPEINDFVAMLKPNLFKPAAVEQLYVNILKSVTENKSIDRFELMQDELKRIKELRESLEELTGIHSNTIEDEIINQISQLCLEIRIVEKNNSYNITHEELTGEKEGIHGLGKLKDVYEKAFELLKSLVAQPEFSRQIETSSTSRS